MESVAGDGQRAAPGAVLPERLVARILDADGRPVRDVAVHWSASAGEITPSEARTDAEGTVRVEWRLGNAVGEQQAVASTDALSPLRFLAFAYAVSELPSEPLRFLPFETYDGSGQVVHPDVAAVPAEWDTGPLRLAITPYPWGNANRENPSLFASADGDAWSIPAGAANPIVLPERGYLSDPDIVFVPEMRELWLYYRQVTSGNEVRLVRSRDGVRWTAPRVVASAKSHRLVSPSVVRLAPDDWLMWSVDAGAAGCDAGATTVHVRRSRDGLAWSAPQGASLDAHGLFAWHLDVQWIAERGEYWMLFNAKSPGSCTTEELQLATSRDGVVWTTYPSPVLRRGAIPALADIVYRATFSWDATGDAVTIWHSGAKYGEGGYEWRAAIERRSRAELFRTVSQPAELAISADPPFRRRGPPLDNRTAP